MRDITKLATVLLIASLFLVSLPSCFMRKATKRKIKTNAQIENVSVTKEATVTKEQSAVDTNVTDSSEVEYIKIEYYEPSKTVDSTCIDSDKKEVRPAIKIIEKYKVRNHRKANAIFNTIKIDSVAKVDSTKLVSVTSIADEVKKYKNPLRLLFMFYVFIGLIITSVILHLKYPNIFARVFNLVKRIFT